eukprot:2307449-Amphidinium_carterae.1
MPLCPNFCKRSPQKPIWQKFYKNSFQSCASAAFPVLESASISTGHQQRFNICIYRVSAT